MAIDAHAEEVGTKFIQEKLDEKANGKVIQAISHTRGRRPGLPGVPIELRMCCTPGRTVNNKLAICLHLKTCTDNQTLLGI